MNFETKLTEIIAHKKAIISIVGLGYVGLPLALRFAEVGFKTIGFDIDETRVKRINAKHSAPDISDADENDYYLTRNFHATANIADLKISNVVIICVPTPLNKYREPDLSHIIDAIEELKPYLKKGQLISLESTTYPGTTEEQLKTRIESTGLKVGKDIFLVYSPERIDPGNKNFTVKDIPKICGGITEACAKLGKLLYSNVVTQVILVSSTKAAEMAKLLENIYRAVNIGLVNEMKIVADKMGVNIYEIIHAAATKPFGYVPYYPGPGLGGHCIPVDPFYLTWKAREYGAHTKFIELANEVNSSMPLWVVQKITEALNTQKKTLNGSAILVLGVAYKNDIEDVRESPALTIIKMLHDKHAAISYCDPYVSDLKVINGTSLHLKSETFTKGLLEKYDCIVLATAHKVFDFELIYQNAKLLVDTRGVFHKAQATHVIQA